jgi:2',3'-cyclic-nucleotide 2'-phosphodiesterase (5'-nucleotidase family)
MRASAQAPVLVVDTGNTLTGGSDGQSNELLVKAMTLIGYDALNAGRGELLAGGQALQALQSPGAPAVVSSNAPFVPEAQGRIKPYAIRSVNGTSVGIIGITGRDTAGASDPGAAVARIAPEVRRQAGFVVVIADLDRREANKLAATVPGIQVIVTAKGSVEAPANVGGTVVAAVPGDGAYVGWLDLTVSKDGEVASFRGGAKELVPEIAVDPDTAALRASLR